MIPLSPFSRPRSGISPPIPPFFPVLFFWLGERPFSLQPQFLSRSSDFLFSSFFGHSIFSPKNLPVGFFRRFLSPLLCAPYHDQKNWSGVVLFRFFLTFPPYPLSLTINGPFPGISEQNFPPALSIDSKITGFLS